MHAIQYCSLLMFLGSGESIQFRVADDEYTMLQTCEEEYFVG